MGYLQPGLVTKKGKFYQFSYLLTFPPAVPNKKPSLPCPGRDFPDSPYSGVLEPRLRVHTIKFLLKDTLAALPWARLPRLIALSQVAEPRPRALAIKLILWGHLGGTTVKRLPSAQGVIPALWDRAPHQAPPL